MFHDIPREIEERMHYLEARSKKEKAEGKPMLERLRQVPPDTGRFLALLAASSPEGTWLEIGTSGGYSALWLALACRHVGRKLVTFEVLEPKIKLAKETLKAAGVEDVVELVQGDAREQLTGYRNVSFCFLDAEKDQYLDCYEKVIPNMVPGGLLVADNVTSHQEQLREMVERVLSDDRVDALVVPIESGELVCRKL
jgi:caffeoyl-CoA O-methyltransferase